MAININRIETDLLAQKNALEQKRKLVLKTLEEKIKTFDVVKFFKENIDKATTEFRIHRWFSYGYTYGNDTGEQTIPMLFNLNVSKIETYQAHKKETGDLVSGPNNEYVTPIIEAIYDMSNSVMTQAGKHCQIMESNIDTITVLIMAEHTGILECESDGEYEPGVYLGAIKAN